ncbi:dihydropteroate synthase [uncultured Mesonia sp.]|uniref:dihydropteroate synthase n=1 Tax=uncultured Mesonia sp. TaxID=399731 RepID=UPI00374E2F04
MTINCKGSLIDLSSPKIMGILNLTPDSFYDGGQYKSEIQILRQTEKMLSEGADFIDLGGYSSRPGAKEVGATEECQRVLPVIELILKHFPETLISIDTFRSEVAEKSIGAGAAIINDISAGELDQAMLSTAAKLQVPYIMMHMRGNPKTMQSLTQYQNLTQEIIFYFSKKIQQARDLGLNDIIIDPGFGFAKSLSQNYTLLNELALLQQLQAPILIGVSRKSMIYKLLDSNAQNALNGTTVLHTLALQKGAQILRVHDVKEAKECVRILDQLKD